jgi:hypothetical protein
VLVPLIAGSQQRVDVRRAAVPNVSVRIAGTFGTLRVVGSSSDSLIVTGTLPKDARFESFAGGKGDDPLRGAKMFVDVPSDRAAAGGTLELRVPQAATVWAKAGNATIEVSGVTGELDLNIVGGSIRVVSNPRALSVESMDGNVTIEGKPAWVRAKTAAGDIVMRGFSEDAAFTTVSGTIRVGPGRLERARFESVTGAIEFSGDPVRGGSLTFDSHSGPIELRLDPKQGAAGTGAGADIDATSVTGTIENSLTRQRPIAGREGRGQELGTTFGGGGARITIRSFKGSIKLANR